jgi:Histidine kinase-, DNA gyrase B-, and HSP90-like ATPase
MSDRSRHAPPKASSMIEALRGLGYSPWTALADLIDNSIAAGATTVDVHFRWPESGPYIAILDNGSGMSADELDRAMRLGERSPLEQRAPHDLGRFGLGLKTASFSQCRRLTVASKRSGHTECLRWDLDVVANSSGDGWYILEGPAATSAPLLEPLEIFTTGTIVLWEVLDRIVTPYFTKQDFLDLADRVEQHLGMVFNEFISGPDASLKLSINGTPIQGWDPFLTAHEATYSSPVDPVTLSSGGEMQLRGHVLPHKDRLTEAVYRVAGGPDGWTAQQGFYVYRNRRLIVHGDWLGLGRNRAWTKEQAHQLARLRIDLPGTADTDWNIDIRKSRARPPVEMRPRLVTLAEDIRERARRVFAHRGQAVRIGAPPVTPAWRAEHFGGRIRYRIDEEHPAVRATLDDAGEAATQIRAMLRIIEETIPIQRIWLDSSESHERSRAAFADEPMEDVRAIVMTLYRNLVVRKGMPPARAREQLLQTEPFERFEALIAELPDVLERTGDDSAVDV